MKDYYKILEVNENASKEVIEKAYKVLVKRYHPDIQNSNSGSNLKILDVNEAYSVLSDDYLKEKYDRERQIEKEKKIANNYVETDYSRIYKEKEKNIYQNDKKSINFNSKKDDSYEGILELLKEMMKFDFKFKGKYSIKKINILVLILSILIVVFIGLAMYCIPYTRQWIIYLFPLLKNIN